MRVPSGPLYFKRGASRSERGEFTYAVRAVHPYTMGRHKHDGTWIYVNRGTGYWSPPLRIGVPPEVTVIRLVSSF